MPIYPSSPRGVMRTREPPESCMVAAVRLHTALLQDSHLRAHVVHAGLNYLACSPPRFTVPVGYGQRGMGRRQKKEKRRLAHSGSTGNLDSRHQGGEHNAWYPNRLSGPRPLTPTQTVWNIVPSLALARTVETNPPSWYKGLQLVPGLSNRGLSLRYANSISSSQLFDRRG
ncbi:uncharacterized protein LY79DRAFT_221570 [Colletotrichum navitas]|uniref:Uncharacterized protein n=1 Tax=Colletotrichum navitas TaxID=681940 RepID=A0AAD8V5K4_9PEZI|nr:uncharacterized protein LY79DRAFT_221570 [Colletotrichum navitas]KAK1590328.1 hypothetical protein LY79DRAFT_221570 [Colletotrichum navitas]